MGKRRKSGKLKRSHLKRFSSTLINAGKRLTTHTIPQPALRSVGFSMPGRPRVIPHLHDPERMIRNPDYKETIEGSPKPYGFDEPVPATKWKKEHVEAKTKLVQSRTNTGLEKWHYISYVSNKRKRQRLFFHGKLWMWVYEDFALLEVKRSCYYPSKAAAEHARDMEQAGRGRGILWNEIDKINPSTPE